MTEHFGDDDYFATVSDHPVDTLDGGAADGPGHEGSLWDPEDTADASEGADASGPTGDPWIDDQIQWAQDNGADPDGDPYGAGGYDPYTDSPYGMPCDPFNDPCFGDPGYDPYVSVFGDQPFDIPPLDMPPFNMPPFGDPDSPFYDPAAQGADPYADPYGPGAFDPAQGADPWAPPVDYANPAGIVVEFPDWQPSDFDGVGDPLGDAQNWHYQQGQSSCAVVAQGSVLSDLTGQPFNEDTLVQQAVQAGIFDPASGTMPDDVGKLLELNGVQTDIVPNATVDTLIDSLQAGDKVMVGLDANEIWEPQYDATTGQPIEQEPYAGHRVWVTGIDTQPDGSVYVILNDSGTPDGRMEPVELNAFLNAWSDSGNHTVVAHPVGT